MKSSNIGGQAVMEGIMMRHKDKYSVAVRKPNQEIEVKVEDYKSLFGNREILKKPIVRGVVSFVDSLVVGTKCLMYSASFYEEEEEENQEELTQEEREEKERKEARAEKIMMYGTMVFSIVLSVGIFMVLPYLLASLLRKAGATEVLVTVAEGFVKTGIFLGYMVLISRMKDIQRVFMYHGAEHKCINCVEHGLDLNVENVKKSSRFHKRCGTSFLFLVVFISILFFACIRTDSAIWRFSLRILLVPVIAGVAYEFLRLAGRSENAFVNLLSKPGLWFQKFTTKEPDEDMIEVAIASVEAVFDWKPYVEKVRGEGAAEAD